MRVTHVNSYRGPQGLLSGRRTEVRFRPDGSRGFQKFDLGFGYDRWGNVSRIRYPELVGLSQCTPAPTVDLDWDPTAIREVVHEDTGRQLLYNVSYDPATGMMTDWVTAAGTGAVIHEVSVDGTRARVARIKASASDPAHTVLFDTGDYTYDVLGNVLSTPGDSSRSTLGWAYTYDDLSRLDTATSNAYGARAFTMDDFGNLIPQGMTSDDVDATTNRLSGAFFSYDERGNLEQEPTPYSWVRRLRFDPLNRLVAVWGVDVRAPDEKFAFAYDAAGERVLRYLVDGTVVTSAEFYLRDLSGNLLTQLTWSPGSPSIWTREGDWVYAGREPMVRMEHDGASWHYTSLVTDHLGTTRVEVTDGFSVDYTKYDYWPYGDLVATPASSIYEKHLFTAHEREFLGTQLSTATLGNLDYMHQREYTHRLGRFLSLDPVGGSVGSSQSWNRYSYVRNNPLNLIDPYGEAIRLLFNFRSADSLTDEQRKEIMDAVKAQWEEAGVKDVEVAEASLLDIYVSGGSRDEESSDAKVLVTLTDQPLYVTNKPREDMQRDGTHSFFNAEVSLARALGMSREERLNFTANTISHEAGHPLFAERNMYVWDTLTGNTAERGTIMESGVMPAASAQRLRFFSAGDAAVLRQLLNPGGGP